MSVSPVVVAIIQIIVAGLLVASVMVQPESSGLGSSFGGPGGVYHSKRGSERSLFYITLTLAIAFLLGSVIPFLGR